MNWKKEKKKKKNITGKKKFIQLTITHLQDLLESTVDGRPHGLALVEIDGGQGTLADAFGSELEFLPGISIQP